MEAYSVNNPMPLQCDHSAEDELPPLVANQFQEFRMVDPEAITRSTHYVMDMDALAEAMGLPPGTDSRKVLRLAREKLVERGLAKPLTQDEWVQMGARFYQERA